MACGTHFGHKNTRLSGNSKPGKGYTKLVLAKDPLVYLHHKSMKESCQVMTLKEKLAETSKSNLVRIGSRLGSGFIFVGKVGDCDLEILNDTYSPDVEDEDFIPFQCREVTGVYPSIKNSSVEIIIIDGAESEFDWDDSVESTEVKSLEGVRALLGAVYKQAKDDLFHHYKREYEERDSYVRTIQKINHLEAFFRNDPYGILPDPESIIDDTRHKAYEEMQLAKASSPKKKKGGDEYEPVSD